MAKKSQAGAKFKLISRTTFRFWRNLPSISAFFLLFDDKSSVAVSIKRIVIWMWFIPKFEHFQIELFLFHFERYPESIRYFEQMNKIWQKTIILKKMKKKKKRKKNSNFQHGKVNFEHSLLARFIFKVVLPIWKVNSAFLITATNYKRSL